MKKLLLTSALLAALPLVVQASDVTFRAGTYEASADGIHGPVVVKTTFSSIKSIPFGSLSKRKPRELAL